MCNYYKDGMIGLIVGDAVGMPVQFEDRYERVAEPVTDMLEHRCFDMPKGAWTDDSSLALATLYSIKEQGKLDIDDIAKKFSMWLSDGLFTPLGYAYDIGSGCMNAINSYIRTKDAKNCGGKSEYDNGNGSLMRILPSCIYANDEYLNEKITLSEAVSLVEASSAITHAHDRSKIACGIYFFLVKAIIEYRNNKKWAESGNECPPFISSLDLLIEEGLIEAKDYYKNDISRLTELSRFGRLFELSKFKDLPEESINSTGYVLDSIEAAIWSLVNTDNYRDCILKAVNLGGDTDTIAAIAGGLAGLFYGYEDIAKDWADSIMRKEWIEELCDFSFPLATTEEKILTDCHSHYMPGIDDGATDIEMAKNMLHMAYDNGIRDIICTPHSWAILETNNTNTFTKFNEFKGIAESEIPGIKLHLGCEVLFDLNFKKENINSINEGFYPSYESGKCVLVELYFNTTEKELLSIIECVKEAGYTPVLAHLERYPELFPCKNYYRRIDGTIIEKIIKAGALIQVNIKSLYSYINKEENTIARFLLYNKYVHFLGTDTHKDYRRTPDVIEALAYVYMMCDREYAKDICYRNAKKWLLK